MSILKVNAIEPEGATTAMIVGQTGQNTVIGGDSIKVNTLKTSGYKIEDFTVLGANTWTCPAGVTAAEILIVAGGGGGAGAYYGGGGGAGGVVHHTNYTVVPAVVYDITVGAKGDGGGNSTQGSSGSNSVFNVNAEGSGITMTAIGGGGGGDSDTNGLAGGSGGGAGATLARTGGASNQPAVSGASVYGSAGGGDASRENNGKGGGGATQVGGQDSHPNGGYGGSGKFFSSFTAWGTDVNNASSTGTNGGYFAGGGGGAHGGHTGLGGKAGVGGGGVGSDYDYSHGQPAIPGTGGGGGAAGHTPLPSGSSGASGGSGIVLVKYKMAGGTGDNVFTSNGSGAITSSHNKLGGSWHLLSSQTASNTANLEFTNNISGAFSSHYKEFVFKFYDINPASDSSSFQFQASSSTSGSYTYGISMTGTLVKAQYIESGGNSPSLAIDNGSSSDNATAYQSLSESSLGFDADQCLVGEMQLFNPSSTKYHKHWFARVNFNADTEWTINGNLGGVFNNAAAITGINFKMASGNFDGKIKMYGIK